ncbi:hypothetical protein [Nostoc sp.]
MSRAIGAPVENGILITSRLEWQRAEPGSNLDGVRTYDVRQSTL